jgi:predicted Ser/Thr protein kinase
MNCPRCGSTASETTLQQFGGVCPGCLLKFADEKDAPAFPNLEIISMLGEGGMGVVYKATQTHLSRTVALKVLSPKLGADPAFAERFTREAQALAQMNHPNIVALYDSGIHDGVPYLIMEYVEGTSLRSLLEGRSVSPSRALEIVVQVCDALQYAHARGVVHRDIKPENILIEGERRVKIADFGLAKIASEERTRLTRTNAIMGTPQYMAPEQIENPSAVDHRADLYSLGVIFYEMLTGELPLGRFKPPSQKAPVDPRLDAVVFRLLAKEPELRPSSAEEVKKLALLACSSPAPAEAPGGSVRNPASPGPRWAFLSPGLAALMAVLDLCMLIVTDGHSLRPLYVSAYLGNGGAKLYQVATFLLFLGAVSSGMLSLAGVIRGRRSKGTWAAAFGIAAATCLLGIPFEGPFKQIALVLLPLTMVGTGLLMGAAHQIRTRGVSSFAFFSGVDFLAFLASGVASLFYINDAGSTEGKILEAACGILGILMNVYAIAALVQITASRKPVKGRWVAFTVLAGSLTLAVLGALLRVPPSP